MLIGGVRDGNVGGRATLGDNLRALSSGFDLPTTRAAFRVSAHRTAKIFHQNEQVHRVGGAGIELGETLVEVAGVFALAVDQQGPNPGQADPDSRRSVPRRYAPSRRDAPSQNVMAELGLIEILEMLHRRRAVEVGADQAAPSGEPVGGTEVLDVRVHGVPLD